VVYTCGSYLSPSRIAHLCGACLLSGCGMAERAVCRLVTWRDAWRRSLITSAVRACSVIPGMLKANLPLRSPLKVGRHGFFYLIPLPLAKEGRLAARGGSARQNHHGIHAATRWEDDGTKSGGRLRTLSLCTLTILHFITCLL